MTIQLLIIISATSLLSGVLGMGGGMILMGALFLYAPVKIAILVHGVIQLHSNGFRALLNKKYIQWKVLPYYFIGNLLGCLTLHLILDKIKESQFSKYSQLILFSIGSTYLLKGMTI